MEVDSIMSVESKRRTRINVSLSDSEVRELDRLAVVLGTNRPGAIRWAIDRMDRLADGRRDSGDIAAEVAGTRDLSTAFQSTSTSVLVAINRIGANVNQIARRVNSGQHVQVSELRDEVTALRDEVAEYLENLVGAYSIFGDQS